MNNTISEENLKRLQQGKNASIVGVCVNFVLFVIKIIIGVSVKSVALAADAVNNLTDALSSGVAMIGFNVAAAPADDEHPFGHGRMEDISALIVAVLVTAIGLDFGKSAIEKIISPSDVSMNLVQTAFILFTVFMKLGLFFYFRFVGRKIDSSALQGAAFDSLSDIIGTVVVLVSVGVNYLWGWHLDGWAGLIVAAMILKGGIGLIKETVEPLLGGCPDTQIVDEMRSVLMENPDIHGVHDIIIHSYGHNCYFATAHAELSENLSSRESHDILEAAEIELSRRLPIMAVLHCDPFSTDDPEVKEWRVRIENCILSIDELCKVYDFKMDKKRSGDKTVLQFYFHLLVPRKYLMKEEEIRSKLEIMLRKYPEKTELNITFINSFV